MESLSEQVAGERKSSRLREPVTGSHDLAEEVKTANMTEIFGSSIPTIFSENFPVLVLFGAKSKDRSFY